MYAFIKPLLFRMPAETAHHFTTKLLKLLFWIPGGKAAFRAAYSHQDQRLHKKLFGLEFKNPVGLAAGFDKNAAFIPQFAAMGFGFIEIGTVTPLAQEGNPKPRLFRLKKDRALINRMGFNNAGMQVVAQNLRKKRPDVIIGGNIGKNKITPNEEAKSDYLKCFEELFELVDYFVINVSSPNTPDLRKLQDKEPLTELIQTLQKANALKATPKPILLKIAPDLTDSQLEDIVEICESTRLDGLIATNTTIDRSGLHTSPDVVAAIGAGGLSGAPVFRRSTEIIRFLREKLPNTPLIAVGGILSAEDAVEKFRAGADLVQVYSGLVYRGPGLVKSIHRAILREA